MPCVRGGLPRLVDLHDDYADYRDQFVILTVHTGGAKGMDELNVKTIAEYDRKIERVIRDYWHGRNHPFPVLVDDGYKTFEAYSVDAVSTSVLIDPQGNVVGAVDPGVLAAKFPKPRPERLLPRLLDRKFMLPVDKGPLTTALKTLGAAIEQEITFATPELEQKAKGCVLPTRFFLHATLKSEFDLLLAPFDMKATIGPKGYVVTTKSLPDPADPSPIQKSTNARIERDLASNRGKLSFEIEKKPLEEVIAAFDNQAGETILLDPRAVLDGKIDPRRVVSLSLKEVPLGQGLKQFVESLGLRLVVRDEVIVVEP